MAMVRRAIKEGWPITPQLRRILVDKMADVMTLADDERTQVAAAKVLIAADAINTKREAMDQADDHKAQPDLHLHAHADIEGFRREVVNDPEYLDFLRTRIGQENGYPGPVHADGDGGQAVDSPAPGIPGPSDNGHD